MCRYSGSTIFRWNSVVQISAILRGVGSRKQEPVYSLLFKGNRPAKRLRGQIKQSETQEEHVGRR